MPGRHNKGRTVSPREIQLLVDGEEITLNGYVQDVFQETILALVRTLGTCNEASSIAITIAPDGSPDAAAIRRASPERG